MRINLQNQAVNSVIFHRFYVNTTGQNVSKLFRNVPCFNSLEMSSGDLTPIMLGWRVEIGGCIFSRDDLEEGCISSLVESFVAFDE